MRNGIQIAFIIIILTSGCVPARQFSDLKNKYKNSEDENSKLRQQNQDLSTSNADLTNNLTDLRKRITVLEKDSSETGKSLRKLNELHSDLTKSYEKLLANNEKLLSCNTAETRKIIAQLNATQEELQKKEDALKATSDELEKQKAELKLREDKLNELQSILDRKDSVVKSLKNTVSDALLGFKDQGLSVEQRNGKVYVSLEERLLFASGSTVVDPKGQDALRQLAKVLEKKPDISVMVEGHTDDVPMKGSGEIKDNWDLSVLRATSVTKILITGTGIDPKRISASGRGEFFPMDSNKSPEARKKNRRTEIILTPKLDELLKVLESN